MKGVGLAQSIGRLGWENVPSPKECQKMRDDGILPFLNQSLDRVRSVMPKNNLDWLPPYMQRNPNKFLWLPDEHRRGKTVSNWKLR
jgi:hypothetical protein